MPKKKSLKLPVVTWPVAVITPMSAPVVRGSASACIEPVSCCASENITTVPDPSPVNGIPNVNRPSEFDPNPFAVAAVPVCSNVSLVGIKTPA